MHPASLRAVITGVGHHAPTGTITNADLETMVDTSDEWIRERTGIVERRISAPGQATSDLAVEAARNALSDAGCAPEDLDFILVGTATPDTLFPATACIVQDRIGAVRAAACDVSCGCSGFVYAMSIASQFIQTGAYRRILVIGADTLSKIVNWKDRNTCVLFGDGAGAVVLEPSNEGFGIMAFSLHADGSGADLLKLPAGGSRRPATAETTANGQHYLHMAGSEVFKFAVKAIADATLDVLAQAGVSIEDVDLFVPHQANRRIMIGAARRIGIPEAKVFSNVERYGNTSCASIPMAISEAVQYGRVRKGDIVAICAFGAGLGWGGAVMRWGYTRTISPTPGHASPFCHSLQPDSAPVEPCV